LTFSKSLTAFEYCSSAVTLLIEQVKLFLCLNTTWMSMRQWSYSYT